MAPRLPVWKHAQIEGLLRRGTEYAVIAEHVGCSDRAVRRIEAKLKRFGTTTSPPTRVGRYGKIDPFMRAALREELANNTSMYRDEMIKFIREKFGVEVSPTTMSRTLKSIGWSRKVNGRVAQQRDLDLRDFYMYRVSEYKSYQLVFIDESGCDKRTGHRRYGWAPVGVTPVQVARFSREQRFQVLAAYTQNGVKLARVYSGSTDASTYENFIEQLLCHCGRWPEPNSVLVMDNASIHHSDRIKELCANAGVRLCYLSPYSPDFNPIEEYFAELKAYIKRLRPQYADLYEKDFMAFVKICVDAVGVRRESAEGHFRHSGISIEYPPKSTP
ncbi:uncharacterized protein CTRU02_215494 [Colletotrichum truncatum]|uniref:Uncharacterized protein n=1 Tax=Colletotrichum truncatum TaxID=5467 RepID=A0ACC3YCP5_COLTU|nr:uncharacterized protein CTRU02_05562 [Colletotrichum truncatum]KAF6794005.1 hypothetical protein CTRU02_05562 [Colletotrichum truncatum]